MEQFNKYKHIGLITRWWLQDPELVALLKKDRGYKLPADWIKDLENTKGLIFTNGIGEVRDIWLGEKSKEAEIFYYSQDKIQEVEIAGKLINWCLNNGVTKIRIKQLEVKEQILTRETILGVINLTRGNNGTTISSKNTAILSENTAGYTTSTTGEHTTTIPISKELSNDKSTTKDSAASPATTSTASKEPINNNIRSKKLNSARKKKQSIREEQSTAITN